ncbi:Matrixin [Geodermatophilus telluris]|uniref:Matrixin n=1 Tax=Geodermatophilus telluris TaxID=1190417 RepID=A0A1G6U3D9_9ACTN|nr:matrixin family metalloprotease [Geodermatophilus telluris]SDD35910.1 Matrixin [Geodermatophilus telluris]
MDGGAHPGSGHPALPQPRGAVRGAPAVVLALALALGATWVADRPGWPPTSAAAGPAAVRPTPGVGAADAPLGQPPTVPEQGTWSALQHQGDGETPVAYDPCRPVHYVVRSDGGPAGAARLVAEAVAEVSAATGLRFVADGGTDEGWSEDRPAAQPGRYGDRWAPVLVSWETPATVPALAGTVAGVGGSEAWSAGGPYVYVTGAVAVDAEWARSREGDPEGRAALRGVLVHELAHVVGLGHVEDPGELMSPHGNATGQLGPGDRAGLARLGRGACEPRL